MSATPTSISHGALQDGYQFLETTTSLPRPVDEVFRLFADAENLQRITPPELAFRVRNFRHRHSFSESEDGTRMVDRFEYRLPLQPAGALALLRVRRPLDRIFRYRADAIRRLVSD